MAELTAPVARRKPNDPLVYLFASREDGWSKHGIAFKSIDDLQRTGWVLWEWRTDDFGEYALARRAD